MSSYLGLMQFGLFASCGFACFTALISRAVYPWARKQLLQSTPERRSNILLIWLLAPAFIGLLFTLLSLMPSLLSLMGIDQDHCGVHDGHLHLCLIHPPLPVDNMISWVFITVLAVVAIIFAGTVMLGLVRGHKLYNALMMASRNHDGHGLRIVEWDGPLAVSAGLYRMSVFISKQLIQSLTSRQLDVVLAHEQKHAQRKDALRQLLAHTLSFAHLPGLRSSLLADMDLACEQACDEAAARIIGDRLYVAETIVSIERMFIRKPLPFTALSISGSNITERVESLVQKPAVDSCSWRVRLILGGMLLLLAAFASAGELHHHTESILGFLAR